MTEREWTKILGWPGYRVYRHEINEPAKTLKLWVRRKRGNRGLVCSGCGRRIEEIHEIYEREVRDLPCFEFKTTVVIELYRVRCPDCGIKSERVPLLPSKAPFSKRFEDAVGLACESAPARRVARQFGLPANTVRAIDLRYLERWSAARRKPAPHQMGVDEIHVGKTQKFLTVVCNLETGEPLWFGRERKKETLDEYFRTELSAGQRRRIEAASRYILNRLVSTRLEELGLYPVSNTYDQWALTDRTGLREHSTAAYGTGFAFRGNLTTASQPGSSLRQYYDIAGTPTRSENANNSAYFVTFQPSAATNNAAPGRIAARDENDHATTLAYSTFLGLSAETGPNGDTGTLTYDAFGRAATRTSPHGAVTNYTYDYPNRQVTAATAHGGGIRYERTTADGLGRTTRAETWGTNVPVSMVETQYIPCACSPLGKVWRVSQPYPQGSPSAWTT